MDSSLCYAEIVNLLFCVYIHLNMQRGIKSSQTGLICVYGLGRGLLKILM